MCRQKKANNSSAATTATHAMVRRDEVALTANRKQARHHVANRMETPPTADGKSLPVVPVKTQLARIEIPHENGTGIRRGDHVSLVGTDLDGIHRFTAGRERPHRFSCPTVHQVHALIFGGIAERQPTSARKAQTQTARFGWGRTVACFRRTSTKRQTISDTFAHERPICREVKPVRPVPDSRLSARPCSNPSNCHDMPVQGR